MSSPALFFFLFVIVIVIHMPVFSSSAPTNLTISSYRLPHSMNSFGVGIYNNELVVFNGWTDNHDLLSEWRLPTTDIQNYDSQLDSWTQNTNANSVPFGIPGMEWLCDSIQQAPGTPFVYGAFPTIEVPDYQFRVLFIYDLSVGAFLNTSDYEALSIYGEIQLACAAFDSLNNDLFIVGRFEQPSCFRFDVDSNLWSTCANVGNRIAPGCSIDGSSQFIFAFGGKNVHGGDTYLDSIKQYNVSADTWHLLSTSTVKLKEKRENVVCTLFVLYDEQIICAGGSTGSGSAVTHFVTVEIFNPRTLSINSTTYQLNIARIDFRMIVAGNCMLFMGGR